MLNRKERTIEKYINAGAQMRLFTTIARDMACKISEVVSAADADRVMKALHIIELICVHAEDNMFRDFPKLPGEYTDVFYGYTFEKPKNAVDEMVVERARESLDELFRKAD